jgi:hypothetical protein
MQKLEALRTKIAAMKPIRGNLQAHAKRQVALVDAFTSMQKAHTTKGSSVISSVSGRARTRASDQRFEAALSRLTSRSAKPGPESPSIAALRDALEDARQSKDDALAWFDSADQAAADEYDSIYYGDWGSESCDHTVSGPSDDPGPSGEERGCWAKAGEALAALAGGRYACASSKATITTAWEALVALVDSAAEESIVLAAIDVFVITLFAELAIGTAVVIGIVALTYELYECAKDMVPIPDPRAVFVRQGTSRTFAPLA